MSEQERSRERERESKKECVQPNEGTKPTECPSSFPDVSRSSFYFPFLFSLFTTYTFDIFFFFPIRASFPFFDFSVLREKPSVLRPRRPLLLPVLVSFIRFFRRCHSFRTVPTKSFRRCNYLRGHRCGTIHKVIE